MQFFISFLEGIITFVSPCLLPMIPIYVTYFAAGEEASLGRVFKNALGFVLGFTVVFIAMGAFASTVGSFFLSNRTAVNIVCGAVVVFFGLTYLGIIKIDLFHGTGRSVSDRRLGFFSSFLFGMVFSIGWTPCVGVFLGSALMLASQQGSVAIGVLMLLCYSIGLGIPFVVSALLIDRLKGVFAVIKNNYGIITKICGWFLVAIGILMATGLLNNVLYALQ